MGITKECPFFNCVTHEHVSALTNITFSNKMDIPIQVIMIRLTSFVKWITNPSERVEWIRFSFLIIVIPIDWIALLIHLINKNADEVPFNLVELELRSFLMSASESHITNSFIIPINNYHSMTHLRLVRNSLITSQSARN